MSESKAPAKNNTSANALAATSPSVDWHHLAGQRLARLVELEHDGAVMHERLELLRAEHDALLLLNDDRLHKLHKLHTSSEQRDALLQELTRRYALMESSRSWRVTAPLRAFFRAGAGARHIIARILRAVLRRSRLGPLAARVTPALHARVRSKLSSYRGTH